MLGSHTVKTFRSETATPVREKLTGVRSGRRTQRRLEGSAMKEHRRLLPIILVILKLEIKIIRRREGAQGPGDIPGQTFITGAIGSHGM